MKMYYKYWMLRMRWGHLDFNLADSMIVAKYYMLPSGVCLLIPVLCFWCWLLLEWVPCTPLLLFTSQMDILSSWEVFILPHLVLHWIMLLSMFMYISWCLCIKIVKNFWVVVFLRENVKLSPLINWKSKSASCLSNSTPYGLLLLQRFLSQQCYSQNLQYLFGHFCCFVSILLFIIWSQQDP